MPSPTQQASATLFAAVCGPAPMHHMPLPHGAAQPAVTGLEAPFSSSLCRPELRDSHGAVRAARRLKGSSEHDAGGIMLLARCHCPPSSTGAVPDAAQFCSCISDTHSRQEAILENVTAEAGALPSSWLCSALPAECMCCRSGARCMAGWSDGLRQHFCQSIFLCQLACQQPIDAVVPGGCSMEDYVNEFQEIPQKLAAQPVGSVVGKGG